MATLDNIVDYLAETCNGLLVEEVDCGAYTGTQWYWNGSKDATKAGYAPIGIVGQRLNTAVNHIYKCELNGNNIEFGLAAPNTSSSIRGINLFCKVLYKKIPS